MERRGLVIDSSIFIEYLRANNKKKTLLYKIPNGTVLYISAITLYELYLGAIDTTKWNDIKLLTEGLIVLPINDEIAIEAAKIYHELRKINRMIEFRDIFIAATCKIHKLPLKTTNKAHFNRIKSLAIE